MERDALLGLIEAFLLTSRVPVSTSTMLEAIADDSVSPQQVEELVRELQLRCNEPCRGMRIEAVAGGWRFVTPPAYDSYLQTFHGVVHRQRLSQAALEVLAIVAHRQPVTLPEINFIRGANSAAVVRTLMERKMIRMAGRKKVVGKPFLYRTTKEFLIHFGLDRIEELPDPETLVQPETSVAD